MMTKRNRNIKNIFIKLQFSYNIMANEVNIMANFRLTAQHRALPPFLLFTILEYFTHSGAFLAV